MVSGIAMPTPMTCSAHRPIQFGSRVGQRSKSPNTGIAVRPSVTVRISTADVPVVHCGASIRPMAIDGASATARRRIT
ncbi:MAG: hypothetical protein DMF88_19135 [Acidobacteria bacterium]|nr:MAG: hypothetical protein DMF88_19135 [Acidobacteriota bacterium]